MEMANDLMQLIKKGQDSIQARENSKRVEWDALVVDYNFMLDTLSNEISGYIPDAVLPFWKLEMEKPPFEPNLDWMRNHKNNFPPMQILSYIEIPDLGVIRVMIIRDQFKKSWGISGIVVTLSGQPFYCESIAEAVYLAWNEKEKMDKFNKAMAETEEQDAGN